MSKEHTPTIYFIIFLMIVALFSFILREIYINRYDFKDRLRYNAEGEFPFSYLYVGDAWNYHEIALNLVQGKGYGFPYYPPLFPYTLAYCYRLTAPAGYLESPAARAEVYGFKSYRPTKHILIFINCLALIIAGLAFFYLHDVFIAAIAIFFSAFSFGLFLMSGSFNSEAIYIPLYLLLFAVSLYAYRHQTMLAAIPLGLLGGLLVLCRSESLLIIILTFLYFFIGWQQSFRKRALFSGLFLVAFFVFPVCWGIKNLNQFDEFIVISKNGPVNFYIGNNPLATGGYSEKIFEGAHGIRKLNPRNPEHYQALAFGYKKGLEYWNTNPGAAVELLKRKFLIWTHALRNGFLPANIPGGLNGYRELGDSFYPDSPVMLYIMGLLVCLGLILGIFNRTPGWLFPYIYLGSSLAANLVYFGLTRSGTVMLPLLYMFAAIPVSYAFFFLRTRYTAALSILLALSIVVFVTGAYNYRSRVMLETMDELFSNARQSMKSRQFVKAITDYEKAFSDAYSYPYVVLDHHGLAVAHFNTGSLYVQTGNHAKAEHHYLVALDHDPTSMETAVNLAYLYKDYLHKPREAMYYFRYFLGLDPPEGDAEAAKTELLKLKLEMKNI